MRDRKHKFEKAKTYTEKLREELQGAKLAEDAV